MDTSPSSNRSILARFDDVCRSFDFQEECDNAFMLFAASQEECRKRWAAINEELERMHNKIAEANRTTSKLELQNHHVNVLLREEIKVRTKLLDEKKKLQKQVDKVRECLSDAADLKEETREKLQFLSFGRYPHLLTNKNRRTIEKMDTITEAHTNDPFLASDEHNKSEPSEEELELSGTVRSYRSLSKLKKQYSQLVDDAEEMELAEDFTSHKTIKLHDNESLVATTKVTMSLNGPVIATSTIESVPRSCTDDSERIVPQTKTHCYKKQLIIHQMENCHACNLRIKFGKSALKCIDCNKACHVECESRMPQTCAPESVDTPPNRRLEATSSNNKGALRFFSLPSEKN